MLPVPPLSATLESIVKQRTTDFASPVRANPGDFYVFEASWAVPHPFPGLTIGMAISIILL